MKKIHYLIPIFSIILMSISGYGYWKFSHHENFMNNKASERIAIIEDKYIEIVGTGRRAVTTYFFKYSIDDEKISPIYFQEQIDLDMYEDYEIGDKINVLFIEYENKYYTEIVENNYRKKSSFSYVFYSLLGLVIFIFYFKTVNTYQKRRSIHEKHSTNSR